MLLKEWIKSLDLTQQEISELIGQTQSMVSTKLQTDKWAFSDFIKICRHLEIDPATVINQFQYSPGKLKVSLRVKQKRAKRFSIYESFRQQRLKASLGSKKLASFKNSLRPEDYAFYRLKRSQFNCWYTKEKRQEDYKILFDHFLNQMS